MADISLISRLVSGIQRNVDISTNTLVVNELKVGGSASTAILTQALVETLSQLGSTALGEGASLIGVNASPSNYTAASADVEAHLAGIDSALATAGGTVFSDIDFRVQDDLDATKQMTFELSGMATGTTKTFTIADTSMTFPTGTFDLLPGSAGSDIGATTDEWTNMYANTYHARTGGLKLYGSSANFGTARAVINDGIDSFLPSGGSVSLAGMYTGSATFGRDVGVFTSTLTSASSSSGAVFIESGNMTGTANTASTGRIEIKTGDHTGSSGGASGGISIKTGTSANSTRGDISLDASTITVNSSKITDLANPTAPQDAATKAYVDSIAAGLDPKESVRVATTADVGGTYSSGTITGVSALTVDGVLLATADRVLLKDQTSALQNGIYTYDEVAGTLTRAADHDGTPANEVSAGNFVFVEQGTANENSGWVLQGNGVLTLDTDNLDWTQFSGAGAITAGDGIAKSGSTLSVAVADIAGNGLEDDGSNNLQVKLATISASNQSAALGVNGSGEIFVKTDLNTITHDGSGQLTIIDGAITNFKINAAANIQFSKMAPLVTDRVAITDGSGVVSTATNATPTELENLRDGSNADSLHQHSQLVKTYTAGQSFAANQTHAVRMALNGETAGRVYAADYTVVAQDAFYAFGVIQPTTSITAGDSVDVIMMGEVTLLASDTAFAAAEVGQAVHLLGSGSWDVVSQITYASDQASYRIGLAVDTDKIMVGNMQLNGIA